MRTPTPAAMGVACTAVATVGFRSLPEADQSQVRERVFWRLDYYDRAMRFASEDAANPAITRWVLIITLSDEY